MTRRHGNTIIRTPNLDKLAAKGIAFDACYCNSPLSVPSRLALTAGNMNTSTMTGRGGRRRPGDLNPIPGVSDRFNQFRAGNGAGACSLVDVAATITELAGAKAPSDWDGDSMLQWLDNGKAKWKDLAVSEYYGHNNPNGPNANTKLTIDN